MPEADSKTAQKIRLVSTKAKDTHAERIDLAEAYTIGKWLKSPPHASATNQPDTKKKKNQKAAGVGTVLLALCALAQSAVEHFSDGFSPGSALRIIVIALCTVALLAAIGYLRHRNRRPKGLRSFPEQSWTKN